MKDIVTREDVQKLVDEFYKKVLEDDVIGFIFKKTINFIWEKHIPTMYDFWDSMLFNTAVYKGNPMVKHIVLHAKIELTYERFDRWIYLWQNTIDENFEGEKATLAKQKAIMMRKLMLHKIGQGLQS
jgi:hemoglobin